MLRIISKGNHVIRERETFYLWYSAGSVFTQSGRRIGLGYPSVGIAALNFPEATFRVKVR